MCVRKVEAMNKVDRLIAAMESLQQTLEAALNQKAIQSGSRKQRPAP